MRRSLLLALVGGITVLVGGCGGSDSTPGGPSSTSNRAPVTVKVMTFNIQHGIDGQSKYGLQRAIDTIARLQPDVIGLQEVTRNHPYYNCEDQPAVLQAGLRAATGQMWDVRYEQEWYTPDKSCQTGGRGDGPETEGLVLASRRALGGTSNTALPDSRIGFATSLVDAYNLPVVVTHLVSGGAASAAMRSQQIDRLLAWTAALGVPRILLGDFNAASDAGELQPVLATYKDAWIEAQRAGRAVGSGATHGAARIDYIFYVPGSSLTLERVEAIDTATLLGVAASDHNPVIATFTVR